MLFSKGLKASPTPNAHSASGRGFHFQGAYHGIPTCPLFPRRFVSGSLSLNIYDLPARDVSSSELRAFIHELFGTCGGKET